MNYSNLFSPEDNFEMAIGSAEFHKSVASNMRTQRDALRAFLISLSIPEEEINEKQFAHLDAIFSDTSYSCVTTGYPIPSKEHVSIGPGLGVLD